jgi:hypothetical protein
VAILGYGGARTTLHCIAGDQVAIHTSDMPGAIRLSTQGSTWMLSICTPHASLSFVMHGVPFSMNVGCKVQGLRNK